MYFLSSFLDLIYWNIYNKTLFSGAEKLHYDIIICRETCIVDVTTGYDKKNYIFNIINQQEKNVQEMLI
jgi:hypothetical protein